MSARALQSFAALSAGIAAVGCMRCARRVRGTTLAAPAGWGVVGCAAVACVEALLAAGGCAANTLTASALRYIAATSLWCAPTAVLGAKRPQDRAWQWIVASLWGIVALPALQAVAFDAGRRVEVGGLWAAFTMGLAAYGTALNYAPTRFALPAALLLGAQTCLVAPAIGGEWLAAHADECAAAGGAALLTAVLAATVQARRAGPGYEDPALSSHDSHTRWIAFRNAFGLSWGMRILGRVNELAIERGWPERLAWGGFVAANSHEDRTPSVGDVRPSAEMAQALDALLRRFERRQRDG